jgi:hypothetical protein
MGANCNERNPFVFPIQLGSPSSNDDIVAGAYFHAHRKCKIEKAVLVNGAAILADVYNWVKISLLNGSNVIGSVNSVLGFTADVGKELTLDEDYQVVDNGEDLVVKYEEQEGVKEVTELTCVEGTALDGKFFKMFDELGSVAFWFDVAGGTSEPSHGCTRGVEITTVVVGDTAAQVAAKVATAVDADAKFVAPASVGTKVTITSSTVGTKTDATAQDSGFTVSVLIQGVDAVSKALTNAILLLYGTWIETA